MTATPQQPGLRSFIVYDRVPAGHAAYPITDDRNAPHLHMGDFAIIDPSDTDPCEGELFLMEWRSSPGHYSVNETFSKVAHLAARSSTLADRSYALRSAAIAMPATSMADILTKLEFVDRVGCEGDPDFVLASITADVRRLTGEGR